MNYLKMLGPAVLAAATLMSCLGTASATELTSPVKTTYTGTIVALSAKTSLHGPFTTVTCNFSTVHGEKVEKHGSGVTAGGKLTGLTFEGCNFPVTVLNEGSLEIHASGGGNGTVTSSGAEVTIQTSIANCWYVTSNTDVGTLTGSKNTGTRAILDINSSAIPRPRHSVFCGSSGTWTGQYEVSTPTYLDVD